MRPCHEALTVPAQSSSARRNLVRRLLVNGRQVQRSWRSTKIHDAKRLRNQILGKKSRGEMVAAHDRNTEGIPAHAHEGRPLGKHRNRELSILRTALNL